MNTKNTEERPNIEDIVLPISLSFDPFTNKILKKIKDEIDECRSNIFNRVKGKIKSSQKRYEELEFRLSRYETLMNSFRIDFIKLISNHVYELVYQNIWDVDLDQNMFKLNLDMKGLPDDFFSIEGINPDMMRMTITRRLLDIQHQQKNISCSKVNEDEVLDFDNNDYVKVPHGCSKYRLDYIKDLPLQIWDNEKWMTSDIWF